MVREVFQKIAKIIMVVLLISFFMCQYLVAFAVTIPSNPYMHSIDDANTDIFHKYNVSSYYYDAEFVKTVYYYKISYAKDYIEMTSVPQELFNFFNSPDASISGVDNNGNEVYFKIVVRSYEKTGSSMGKNYYKMKIRLWYIPDNYIYGTSKNLSECNIPNYRVLFQYNNGMDKLDVTIKPMEQYLYSKHYYRFTKKDLSSKSGKKYTKSQQQSAGQQEEIAYEDYDYDDYNQGYVSYDYSDDYSYDDWSYYEEPEVQQPRYERLDYGWERDISDQSKIEYIKSLYVRALNRNYDEIREKEDIGVQFPHTLFQIAKGVIMSPECATKHNVDSVANMDNGAFVDMAYRAMFAKDDNYVVPNRDVYVNALNNGDYTKEQLLQKFINDPLFWLQWYDSKRAFIAELYNKVLKRNGSQTEIEAKMEEETPYYTLVIMESQEAQNAGTSFYEMGNEDFIRFAYLTLLDRTPDEDGKKARLEDLESGYMTREDVIWCILTSGEFKHKMETYTSTPVQDRSDKEVNLSEPAKKLLIRDLYVKVLGKTPTDEEINSNLSKTPQQIAIDIIFMNKDIKKTLRSSEQRKEFIKYLYKILLDRDEVDEEGLDYHLSFIKNDSDVCKRNIIRNIVESEDFSLLKNKEVTAVTLNKELCDAVYNYLDKRNYTVVRTDDTRLIMYTDDLRSIKRLNLTGKNISSIDGLQAFKGLEILLLSSNGMTDISELQYLTNLKTLDLSYNTIDNSLNTIAGLTQLQTLNLMGCGLTNAKVDRLFNNLTELNTLYLSCNELVTVPVGISALTNLKHLEIDHNNIRYISELDNSNLEELDCTSNKIELVGTTKEYNLPEIFIKAQDSNSKVYTNQALEVTGGTIRNNKLIVYDGETKAKVTIKGGKANETSFTYSLNRITIPFKDKVLADRVQRILSSGAINYVIDRNDSNGTYNLTVKKSTLEACTNLDLTDTPTDIGVITNISGLEKFTKLQSVDLSGSRASNLEVLKDLKNLESLTLNNCNLSDLGAIKDVTSLKQLDVSNNNITDITAISSLTNLQDVILSNNNIGDNLSPLANLTKLSNMVLRNNNITSLNSLGNKTLNTIDVSYNKISNKGNVNANSFKMENNELDLNIDASTNSAEIPDIVMSVLRTGGMKNITCRGCSVGSKVTLNDGEIKGTITINSGAYKDTVINVHAPLDTTPPVLTVEYVENNETGMMDVTVHSNEPLGHFGLFEKSADGYSATKSYPYNTKEVFGFRDLAGNVTLQEINVTGLYNEQIPGLRLELSETGYTNQDIEVRIKADVELDNSATYFNNWVLSDDEKTLSTTCDHNVTYFKSVTPKASMEADRAIWARINAGETTYEEQKETLREIRSHTVNMTFSISNIDKDAPELQPVEYSTTETTKGHVQATIWANEDIELVNSDGLKFSKVTKSDDNGDALYGITLDYSQNTSSRVTVKDKAGNTASTRIYIRNIDSSVDGLSVKTEQATKINSNVDLSIKANEAITYNKSQNNSGAVASLLKGQFNLAKAVANKQNNGIMIATANDIIYLDDNSLLTRTADNDTPAQSGSEFTYQASENEMGVIYATDVAGNTSAALFNINTIDKQGPQLQKLENVVNEDGSVTVTVKVNEELENSDALNGWELSEDKTTLTKTFTANANETLRVTDLAGNTTELPIRIDNVNKFGYTLYYDYNPISRKYFVEIVTETRIKRETGWMLSDDETTLATYLPPYDEGYVVVRDYEGNSTTVYYKVPEPVVDEDDGEEEKDNTQADKEFPYTGAYAVVTGMIIVILISLTVIVLKNEQF